MRRGRRREIAPPPGDTDASVKNQRSAVSILEVYFHAYLGLVSQLEAWVGGDFRQDCDALQSVR